MKSILNDPIEIMIIIAIIGILLAISIPNFIEYKNKAKGLELNIEDESTLNKTNRYMLEGNKDE